ncbi:hypothetical protein MUK42_16182 [Musa troglodytarum]|uniref:Uncharacterized protein n=1 Tax=Musa troglodytarum TaxID=320322 RepID=A0A9E7I561_9LILI|nr:hypothetical protein MUK42_16182 [Musa troglodytarum]
MLMLCLCHSRDATGRCKGVVPFFYLRRLPKARAGEWSCNMYMIVKVPLLANSDSVESLSSSVIYPAASDLSALPQTAWPVVAVDLRFGVCEFQRSHEESDQHRNN